MAMRSDANATSSTPRLPSILVSERSTLRKRSGARILKDDDGDRNCAKLATGSDHLFPSPLTRKGVSFADEVQVEHHSRSSVPLKSTAQAASSVASSRSRSAHEPTRTIPSARSRAPSLSIAHAHKFPLPRNIPDELETKRWDLGVGLGLQPWGVWTSFKWCLLVSISTVFVYGMVGLVLGLMLWLQAFEHADVYAATNPDLVIYLIAAAILLTFTALLGLAGLLLNSRPLLAVYTILLVPCFLVIILPAYRAFGRANVKLEGKMNLAWSKWWTPATRLLVQNGLQCCGYYTPQYQAVFTRRCYPRVPPPYNRGCKGPLLIFEERNLKKTYHTLFGIAGVHLANFTIALVCSNHITRTFGKGLTPQQYRLTAQDVQDNASLVVAHLEQQQQEAERGGSNGGDHLHLTPLRHSQSHLLERSDTRALNAHPTITRKARLDADGRWSARELVQALVPSQGSSGNASLPLASDGDRASMGWGRAVSVNPTAASPAQRLVLANGVPSLTSSATSSERPGSVDSAATDAGSNVSNIANHSAASIDGSITPTDELPGRQLQRDDGQSSQSLVSPKALLRTNSRPLPETPDPEALRVPPKQSRSRRGRLHAQTLVAVPEGQFQSEPRPTAALRNERQDNQRLAGQHSWAKVLYSDSTQGLQFSSVGASASLSSAESHRP
ncbi:Tetraspanin family-domain-containing protein [Auriculariales sp. MPI-PUGE-AT-0066]|nr:Tetraspanin family-domain-containing protein [Auriculariales sp. MPI-PUGE-AT-0066]